MRKTKRPPRTTPATKPAAPSDTLKELQRIAHQNPKGAIELRGETVSSVVPSAWLLRETLDRFVAQVKVDAHEIGTRFLGGSSEARNDVLRHLVRVLDNEGIRP